MNKYYLYIQDNKIIGKGQAKVLEVENIEVTQEVFDESEKYIYSEGAIILDPDYEAKQEAKEAERVAKLTCTKRVFALMLQEMGITYAQLKALIATNEQAQLEWDLCVELERKNPLLDIMASQLNVTSEHLDLIFKFANKEITEEEFKLATAPKEEETTETPIIEEVEE